MTFLHAGYESFILVIPVNPVNSLWYYLEIVLIASVILFQFYLTRKVYLNIKELKNIFQQRINIKNGFIHIKDLNKKNKTLDDIFFVESDDLNSTDLFSNKNIVNISIAETPGEGIIKSIKNDINNYLFNNYGATVNFSIIKDIIDREVDIKDEEITNAIPTPLYLGLAATMIGIIFGLFAMPELSGNHFAKGIDALIDGVKLAMFGSLIGLACTTYLSSFSYKKAKKEVLKDKNSQISYLQAKLLPELLKAEESGITGLKASIDKFARDTTGMVTTLYNTSIKTESNLETQNDIIQTQNEIIKKIESIGVTRISKANLELLEKLEKNINSFNQFAAYLELMGRISEQLNDFASRTSSIDRIASHIESSLAENKRLVEFLSSHFNKIENSGKAALSAVDIADSHFSNAIERLSVNTEDVLENLYKSINESSSKFAESVYKLNNEIQTRTEKINQNAADHESKLSEIYNEISLKLNRICNEYLYQLEFMFSDTNPKLDDLKYLSELTIIKEQLINNKGANGSTIIEILDNLDITPQLKINNSKLEDLLIKLESIDDNIKKRVLNQNEKEILKQRGDGVPPLAKKTVKHKKPVSLIEAARSLYKN